jgi:prepilin-type N-terminal cleavage/methylation domain-containing protein
MHNRHDFTLIELLVVIAIIAILSVIVILTLNPAQLLMQARDSNRISDMSTLNDALDGSTVYGTASPYCVGCLPELSINFAQAVSNFSVLVVNGKYRNGHLYGRRRSRWNSNTDADVQLPIRRGDHHASRIGNSLCCD